MTANNLSRGKPQGNYYFPQAGSGKDGIRPPRHPALEP
jgi:hypothetical protein